jgi:hypothetical protein
MKYVDDHWAFDGRNRVLAVAVGLSPVWLLVLFYVTNPHMSGGLGQPTAAEVLDGQRILLAIAALVAGLTLAATVVLWRARSTAAVVGAVLLLTIPALILMVFGPAFAFMLRNLNS